MDKGYEKEEFETLKIKSSVAGQFRKFSKMLSKSQSITLVLTLIFLGKWNFTNGAFRTSNGNLGKQNFHTYQETDEQHDGYHERYRKVADQTY